ncbi:hypothetical protein DL546_008198 [Coniochaeta pulveracea]|uniref:Dienelactone hydrolase domain-containing protein n=1 Tax=Coniochaeta pulveracea TaxID=177199 RepID=A0A420YL38_9PEZI|nr:hypothetical protein DL546_008198 [Coniochaeta pulveracea]
MSCPDCFKGSTHEGQPRGKVIELHGLQTYVSEPSNDKSVRGIIVIIPDAFGWEFVNNRILADHYADKGGFRVYLPEFMGGHAAPVWMMDTFKAISTGGILSKLYNAPSAIYGMVPFVYYNRPGRSYPVVKSFFHALRKAEGADLPVGAAGFCWGGKHTVLLAADEELVDGKRLLDAGFTGHPSMLSVPADVEAMTLPVSFALAENDMAVSIQQAEQIKQIVEGKPEAQRGEAVMYKGCGHGFCIRADATKDDVAKQAAEAEDQCIRWFNKHFGLS